MPMVFSRPIRSEIQPKKGLVSPLAMQSTVTARGRAATPNTITPATPKSLVKLANCEMTINPQVDIIAIIANISQKTRVFSMPLGEHSRPVSTALAGRRPDRLAGPGRARQKAARTPTAPRMTPNRVRVAWWPEDLIMASMGRVVRMAPIP